MRAPVGVRSPKQWLHYGAVEFGILVRVRSPAGISAHAL